MKKNVSHEPKNKRAASYAKLGDGEENKHDRVELIIALGAADF